LLSEFPVREIAMKAKFGLARCRVELEEYDLAVLELEDFIDSYATGDLADDARYLIGLSYLRQAPAPQRDQTETKKALEAFNLLLREYPNSELVDDSRQRILECRSRLAEKEYMSGDLYLKMGHYEAARIYFASVVSEYQDTPWAAWALLGEAEAYARESDMAAAGKAYEKVVTDYPGTAASREASRRLKELASGIGQATEASPQE
jgi:outer membrane protein assembly factor BamD